jgi:ATP-dependent RNA helicase DDX1
MLVDLKGKDAVPDTVDHVLLRVDPTADATWLQSKPQVSMFSSLCTVQ